MYDLGSLIRYGILGFIGIAVISAFAHDHPRITLAIAGGVLVIAIAYIWEVVGE